MQSTASLDRSACSVIPALPLVDAIGQELDLSMAVVFNSVRCISTRTLQAANVEGNREKEYLFKVIGSFESC